MNFLIQQSAFTSTCMKKNETERTAAVILAAGGSTRLGRPKQLLDWFGKTFIEQVVETAIKADLYPIIVVTGSNHKLIEDHLKKKDVEIIFNNNWKEGQSGSLTAGLKKIQEKQISQFIFLLVDMPQLKEEWLKIIVQNSDDNNFDIVTTTVNGEVTPPILFKEKCFEKLFSLKGDSGGKRLVREFNTKYLEHEDQGMKLDCDTEEEYLQLLNTYKKCV